MQQVYTIKHLYTLSNIYYTWISNCKCVNKLVCQEFSMKQIFPFLDQLQDCSYPIHVDFVDDFLTVKCAVFTVKISQFLHYLSSLPYIFS